MGFITSFKRRRAIKSYIKDLPRLLAKDYGRSKTYTPKQVKRTIEHAGLPIVDSCFTIAMFSTRSEFDKYHEEIGEICDYQAMRCDVANNHFNGNAGFETSDINSVSSSYGGSFDDVGGVGDHD